MNTFCKFCIHNDFCYGEEVEHGQLCDHFKRKEKQTKKYHCRDCKWLSKEKCSIGNRCINTNRKMTGTSRFHTNEFKYPSCPACKTGFQLKEELK